MNWWQSLLTDLGLGKLLSAPAPPPPPLAWQPTYEPQAYASQVDGNGNTVTVPIAIDYLADADTAEHLRGIYNPNGTVVAIPFLGPGGPTNADPLVRWLQWPNGVQIVAGLLAVFFTQNPNDPSEADKLTKLTIVAHAAAPIPPEWASL